MTQAVQLSLFDQPTLNITRDLKISMNEAVSECGLSREQIVDAMNNLADRYGVDTVSVVVVTVADGKEVSHENLERVWELKGDASELRNYVTQAVRAALTKVNE